jgi:hypothetical protein
MNIGDRVRVIGTPDNLPPDGDEAGLNTTTVFRRCLGRIFPVVGFNELGHAELEVGEVSGKEPYMSSDAQAKPRHPIR